MQPRPALRVRPCIVFICALVRILALLVIRMDRQDSNIDRARGDNKLELVSKFVATEVTRGTSCIFRGFPPANERSWKAQP